MVRRRAKAVARVVGKARKTKTTVKDSTDRKQVTAAAVARLAKHPDVIAVFCGLRRRDGRWTDEETITVHVRKKRKLKDVPTSERIPKSIDGIPVDVIAVGSPKVHVAEVDTADCLHATYDALDRRSAISAIARNPQGGVMALGSGHGLLPFRNGGYVSGVFAPDAHSVCVLEHPAHAGALSFGVLDTRIDCAVVDFTDLDPPTALVGHVLADAPIPTASRPALGATVQHWAARRGYRVTGKVVGVSTIPQNILLRTDEGVLLAYAGDVIVIVSGEYGSFSVGGESGSLVFDDSRRAVGFVVGGAKDPADSALTITYVLCAFDVLKTNLGTKFDSFFERTP